MLFRNWIEALGSAKIRKAIRSYAQAIFSSILVIILVT